MAEPLPLQGTVCVVCASADAVPLWTTPDRALGVPGVFTVVKCRACGFLYQNPRVRDDRLVDCYPRNHPRHQEPSPRIPLKGSPNGDRAARWALASALRYRHLWSDDQGPAGWLTRGRARLLLRRLRWTCPLFLGRGQLLDVGCGSGAFLAVAGALGWRCSGIEMVPEAASKARRFASEIFVGDILAASFAPGRFDLITAFHVLEHVSDPLTVLRQCLTWLAPDGLLVIEVPNAGGLGAALFGRAWSGLELPRHLSHFTPESLARVAERAGGRVIWCWHQAKPRYYLWSLQHWLRDHGVSGLAGLTQLRAVYGSLKLALELTLPLARLARRGEVIRVGVVRA